MKITVSKQVYDQFDDESREGLVPITCRCVKDGQADEECDSCDGSGTVYEWAVSQETSDAIEENLRKQGVPLGKSGTN